MLKRRNTPTKEAVLSVLANKRRAMSHDAIIKQMDIDVDRSTMYRILNRYCEDGIIHRVVADDGKQYFAVCVTCDEGAIPSNHFHFRCTQCETIECLPSGVEFSVPENYEVQQTNCILIGVCKECA